MLAGLDVGGMGVITVGVAELKPSVSGRRSLRPSSSVRQAIEW